MAKSRALVQSNAVDDEGNPIGNVYRDKTGGYVDAEGNPVNYSGKQSEHWSEQQIKEALEKPFEMYGPKAKKIDASKIFEIQFSVPWSQEKESQEMVKNLGIQDVGFDADYENENNISLIIRGSKDDIEKVRNLAKEQNWDEKYFVEMKFSSPKSSIVLPVILVGAAIALTYLWAKNYRTN